MILLYPPNGDLKKKQIIPNSFAMDNNNCCHHTHLARTFILAPRRHEHINTHAAANNTAQRNQPPFVVCPVLIFQSVCTIFSSRSIFYIPAPAKRPRVLVISSFFATSCHVANSRLGGEATRGASARYIPFFQRAFNSYGALCTSRVWWLRGARQCVDVGLT